MILKRGQYIARTLCTSEISMLAFNKDTDKVEHINVTVSKAIDITSPKCTSAVHAAMGDNAERYTIVKIENVSHTHKKIALSLDDFVKYGTVIEEKKASATKNQQTANKNSKK